MFKRLVKILFVLILTISVFLGQVATSAQALVPTPTPSGSRALTIPVTDPNTITFEMLRRSEIQLSGSYDSAGFYFSIPADWKITDGAQLEIYMGVTFNTLVQNAKNDVFTGGGTLTVLIDNQAVYVLPLETVGEQKIVVPLPADQLIPQSIDQTMTISFVLNSGNACNVAQSTNVFIHPSTRFVFPHDTVMPDTSLVNFPRPIFQNLVITDTAVIVVPDKPSAAELKAAFTVSAGLSNLSGNNLALDLVTVSSLTPEQQKANHIVFVGKAASLPTLSELTLAMPAVNGKFSPVGGNDDDGVVQMVNSPWSPSHVVLVVSGATDSAAVKAAQAVSTGVLQANQAPNVAVIDKVQPSVATGGQAVDRTLAEMGYRNTIVQSRGVNFTRYIFNVPAGYTTASDAYFDLIYGNSAMLNFERSGIVVLLNNRPIGSVRMGEASSAAATNKARIQIPSAAIVPGRNILQVATTLWPTDDCTPPNANQGLWVNIWPESVLHLPIVESSITPASIQKNLTSYLPVFLYNPTLSDTALVVPENNVEAWRAASRVAAYLGDQVNSPLVDLTVFFGNAVPEDQKAKFNFMVVGRPSELPFVKELNAGLPAPFPDGSDTPVISNYRVLYRVSPESQMGFVQIMQSSWNPANIVVGVFGNSTEGVNWATSSLVDSTLSWRLAGNFASVSERQILTTDTTLLNVSAGPTAAVGQGAGQANVLPAGNTNVPVSAPVAAKPNWLLPALLASIVLIVVVLLIVIISGWARNRTRMKRK
jgi:hypothetical protein